MIYNYGPIANPNNAYDPRFIYSHVGEAVVFDVFAGTGKKHDDVITAIGKSLQPQSFATGKTITIKNRTEHRPDGRGCNVLGLVRGSDPVLSKETIILAAHLDHLGRCFELMPGANDNASGVAVLMGVARALNRLKTRPKRSILFAFFGAEEQAVVGSRFYLEHPVASASDTLCLLNLDGVGCGDHINALAAKNYPWLWTFIENANERYVHRVIKPFHFHNLSRPRLDAARFMWAGIPSISFSTAGAPSFYHLTKDNLQTITPEVMEDLAQILLIAVLDLAESGRPQTP
jgi:Iap family predicted aminopeptidase